jgi:transcriptional regulator with XRE-family HTH domain
MVTSAQLRAARSLLNWTVRDLAEKARVHRNTVTRAETDETEHGHAVAQMIRTLEAAGVEFTNGGQPGVRMKATSIPMPEVAFQAGLEIFMREDRPAGLTIERLDPVSVSLKLDGREIGKAYQRNGMAYFDPVPRGDGAPTEAVFADWAGLAYRRATRSSALQGWHQSGQRVESENDN